MEDFHQNGKHEQTATQNSPLVFGYKIGRPANRGKNLRVLQTANQQEGENGSNGDTTE